MDIQSTVKSQNRLHPLPLDNSSTSLPESKQNLLNSWHYRVFLLVLFCAILGYLGLSFWVGWEEMKQAVLHIGGLGIVLALSLTLSNLAVRFVRWQLYIHILKIDVPWFMSLRIYVGGLALTATPGKAGEIIRSVFLKRYDVSYMKSLAIFFADRFTDLVAVLLLAAAGIWANEAARPVALFLFFAITVILLLIRYPQVYSRFTDIVASLLPGTKLPDVLRQTAYIINHCNTLFRMPIFLSSVALSAMAWSLEAINLYLILSLLGAEIAFATVLFAYAFSKLVGAISMIPGGLGSTEATLIALLMVNNIDEATAITCAIFLRLTTFWFVSSLGALVMPKK